MATRFVNERVLWFVVREEETEGRQAGRHSHGDPMVGFQESPSESNQSRPIKKTNERSNSKKTMKRKKQIPKCTRNSLCPHFEKIWGFPLGSSTTLTPLVSTFSYPLLVPTG